MVSKSKKITEETLNLPPPLLNEQPLWINSFPAWIPLMKKSTTSGEKKLVID